MQALRQGLAQCNVRVVENDLGPHVDAHIVNSVQFDLDTFVNLYRMQKLTIVHRIDGPIAPHRNGDRSFDDLCFQFNGNFASASIIQSHWTYARLIEMGYQAVHPVVIHNAVDPEIFHAQGRIPFDRTRKIRLISTSWSSNVRKGGPVYKWIEEHLDWERFEYTFVGRASERFERIHMVEPVPSRELADILRRHDLYITASQGDPCSNSLIEAQACGLPALYRNDGGHPELVGFGGLPFTTNAEILPQLERLVENYAMFQSLIAAPRLDEVTAKYLIVLREAARGNAPLAA
jgi:glycosyltransferase involved in cell wall biosynthesis